MPYLLSALSGLLLCLCVPPLPSSLLVWIALIPLFVAFSRATSRNGSLLLGLTAGLILHFFLFAGAVPYLGVKYLLAVFLYSTPYALLGLLYFQARNLPPLKQGLVFASAWYLLETVLNGLNLPYALGLALYRSPWAGSASFIGLSGLSFCIILINSLVATLIIKEKTIWPATASLGTLILVMTITLIPHERNRSTSMAPAFHVRIVQPNWQRKDYIGKRQEELINQIGQLVENATKKRPADLILLPENFGLYLPQQRFSEKLAALANRSVLLGGIFHDYLNYQSYNSAFLLGPQGDLLARYDKTSLVPLVETGYAASESAPNLFSIQGHSLSPLICFESFLEKVFRRGADSNEGFVLLANDAWAQGIFLPSLHLASLVMHSIEFGRPSLMAGNTLSAAVDATGRFWKSPLYEEGVYDIPFSLQTRETFFRKFGSWFPWLAGPVLVGSLRSSRVDRHEV